MTTKNRLAVVVVLSLLAIAGPALAQVPENNAPGYTVTVNAPGSATKCQEIEVVLDINAQPGGGTESVHLGFSGMVFSGAFCEKAGYGQGPDLCDDVGYTSGLAHWGGSNAYRGKIHAFFIVTASPPTQAYVQALYGPHENGSMFASAASRVSVSSGGLVNVIVVPGATSIPADGASSTTITVQCLNLVCNGLAGQQMALSTSKGTLSAGGSQGSSVTLTTNSEGVGSATLIADTTPGTATLTASGAGGSGSATVDMLGRRLRLTVWPATIPADGTSTSLITATLDDGAGHGVAGESIALTANLGTLVGGGQTGGSVSVQTNSLGDAVANLKSASSAGTATVTAAYTTGSWNLGDSKEVTFEGYTLEYSPTSCRYLNVASKVGGAEDQAQQEVVSDTSTSLIATRYGGTKVKATVVLGFPAGASSPSVAGKTINLRSAEQAALGTHFIAFQQNHSAVTSVTTDQNGAAAIDIIVQDLWRWPTFVQKITVTAELADDTTVTADLVIEVKDNREEVLTRYQTSSLIGEGPVLSAEVTRWVNLNFPAEGLARFNALSGWPGLQNDVLASGAYGVYSGGNDPFVKHTAPWYQHQILVFLHAMQWGPLTSAGNADDRWLLNGLDWGPLFVKGGIHVAVVFYPRVSDGSWESEWGDSALEARILDPWPTQNPVNSVYMWNQWRELLADPELRRAGEGVKVRTYEFIEGQFGGDDGPSYRYPPNKALINPLNGFYYGYSETIPDPYDPMNRSSWLATYVYSYQTIFQCPVYVTITDAQGQKSGYMPPPAAAPLADQIPETYRTLLKKADGTLVWTFAMPRAPVTITIVAYGDGPLSASVIDPVRGMEWAWQAAIVTGDTGTIALDPSSATAPPLVFSGGRTVAAAVSPVLKTGVYPPTGKAIGGTVISVTGIEVRQGATVTIGGAPAVNVTYVHGTALTAVTGRAVRVGPVDVVVTNPGAAPTTLTAAYTYQPAPGLVDLNGDGLGDITFYKPGTGHWAMVTSTAAGGFAAKVGQWSREWTIRAGDFNGDGVSDLFFYHVGTGEWYVGMNDGQGSYTYLPGRWSPGWDVTVLDLNGDAQADVFVYNSQTGAWYQCLTTGPGTFAAYGGRWSVGWQLFPGDFDGNGQADVLVYNRDSGYWHQCLSDGVGGFTYVAGRWSPGWEVAVGDLNGDARSDVFVYNAATGAWYACLTTDSGFTYTPGRWSAGWQVQLGDVDGDGRADVFVYNPVSGLWYVCQSDGAGGFAAVGGRWDPDWEVHLTDFNGDAKADVLVYRAATGRYVKCVTTGLGTFAYTAGQWDPNWTLITQGARIP